MIAELPINTVVREWGPGDRTWVKVGPNAWRVSSWRRAERSVIYSDDEVAGEVVDFGEV